MSPLSSPSCPPCYVSSSSASRPSLLPSANSSSALSDVTGETLTNSEQDHLAVAFVKIYGDSERWLQAPSAAAAREEPEIDENDETEDPAFIADVIHGGEGEQVRKYRKIHAKMRRELAKFACKGIDELSQSKKR